MTIKVAINGMGRIGRSTLAAIIESGRSDIEVISINAPAPIETLVHLMKYDSVHGRFPGARQERDHAADQKHGPVFTGSDCLLRCWL